MPMIERGGIERPPADWRGLPLAPGAKLMQFPTRQAVQAYCEAHNNAAPDPYGHGTRVRACYDAQNGVVAVIQHGVIPDQEWQEEFDHENFHAMGARHDGDTGRDWDGAVPGSVYDTTRKAKAAALARLLETRDGR